MFKRTTIQLLCSTCMFLVLSVPSYAEQNGEKEVISATGSNLKLSDNPIMFLTDEEMNVEPMTAPPPAEFMVETDETIIYNSVTKEETVISNNTQEGAIDTPNVFEPFKGLLPSSPPSESVLGTDGRVQITNTTDYPWRTIARLQLTFPDGSGGGCSGSMVDNFHILTAGHCIHSVSRGGWADVKVYMAQNGSSTPYYYANNSHIRSYTGWTVNQSPDHDWALITLDRNIGAHVGWMGRQTAASSNSIYTGVLNVSGYPGDKPFGTHWYDADYGDSATANRHHYFMDTFGGQSGAPVWRIDGGSRYILTIHAYGAGGGSTNSGTRLDTDKFDRINTWRAADTAPTDKPDMIDDGNAFSGFSPTTASAGDAISAYSDVRNIGTASSGGFYVSYYASVNTFITTSDYLLGNVWVPSISPFAWDNADWSGTLPSGIPPGSYYVGWLIDRTNLRSEFDEGNNKAHKTTPKLTVTAPLPPAAPTLISPNAATADTTPDYTWNAVSDATWYYLWVDDSTGNKVAQWYTAAAAGCGGGTGTCTATPSAVLASGAATWWAASWNDNGSTWSASQAFSVSGGGAPSAATLVSPSGNITDSTPTYTWNAVSSSTWYYLWVDDSSGNKVALWYTAAAAGCGSGTGTCSVTPAASLANGAGTWWIQTWNGSGFGPWSSGMSFNKI